MASAQKTCIQTKDDSFAVIVFRRTILLRSLYFGGQLRLGSVEDDSPEVRIHDVATISTWASERTTQIEGLNQTVATAANSSRTSL